MRNYERLITEELGSGSPKEKYEELIRLRSESMKFRLLESRMAVLLAGIKETPDTATLKHLRNIIEISLDPIQ